ncbi:MAG: bifunctional UDP-sugar hydrolase/5'-nucleotidase [Hyphomonadaceae bacterium]
MITKPIAAAAALAFLAACATAPPQSPTVELHVLAINDFHGNLEPPNGGITVIGEDGAVARVPGGGAARVATLVAQRRALFPHTIMVAAGDLIGASPMLSALFHDEPTIESMNMMGLALSAVGNHEFDEGAGELRRMQTGGCHPVDGCDGPAPFEGADFQYLAASTIVDATGETLFPASAVRVVDGVRVGFIGLALEGTPQVLTPSASAGLSFRDEAETINAEAERLRTQGIEAIVVLIHEGGRRDPGTGDCPGLSGAIVGIVEALHPAVDVVIAGHTNAIHICRINGMLLTSAGQYGALLTDIALTLDRASGDVAAAEAQNLVVTEAIAEDPAQAAHIEAYRRLAAPMLNRRVGEIAAPLTRIAGPAGESALGLVVADSMIPAAEAALGARPDIAFMNPGGVRANLPNPGAVTFSDLFAVTPFGNDLVVLEMSGAEIEAALNQQFRADRNIILQVSDGASFRWRNTAGGAALVPGSIRIGGAALEPQRSYRIVTNAFLASGGDGFTAFQAGRNRTLVGGDLDALAAYVAARSPLAAPSAPRAQLD